MDKKGNEQFFHRLQKIAKTIKKTYLYKLISKFLSVACSIILVLLLIVGAFMFYFNIKANSYTKKGLEYTAPFGLYTIISGSMEPNVSVYDVVVAIDADISKIKVGDIVTFISSWDINYGLTVTHRVVEINKSETGEYQLKTKGDNNGSPDGGIVTQNNLIGKVVGRIPQLGRLQFFLATKMGWFMVVFVPALAIIIFDMIKIFKLYVLKGQLDKVKTTKEVSDEIKEQEPIVKPRVSIDNVVEEDKPVEDISPLPIANEKTKKITKTVLEPIIEEDKNIDTVELPKVGEDGKVKENTLELPTVKNKDDITTTLEQIIDLEEMSSKDDKDEFTSSIPKIKSKKDNDLMPLLNKNHNKEIQTRRTVLKRRK